MSPEQAAGDREIDGRSDIYSLGVVAYQMLTGELPFQAPTVPGLLMKHITERAPLVTALCPECPEDLAACVARCLEKDPDDRWPTADALGRALEARSATVQASRHSGPAAARGPRLATLPEPPPFRVPPAHRGAPRPPAGRRSRRRPREPAQLAPTGEPEIVRKARSSFVSWASVAGGCMVLDAATGSHGWWLFVAVPWAAFGLLPMYMKLWNAGYSWRDVLRRPAAVAAVAARRRPGARASAGPATTAAPGVDRLGDAAPAGRGSDRVVRAGDAERAVRPAAAPVGGRRRRARRPHARHPAGARPVARRRPRDRRSRGDQGGAGGSPALLEGFAAPAPLQERRAVPARHAELQQLPQLAQPRRTVARPQRRQRMQVAQRGPAGKSLDSLGEQRLRLARRAELGQAGPRFREAGSAGVMAET